jgi:hypothetical protein
VLTHVSLPKYLFYAKSHNSCACITTTRAKNWLLKPYLDSAHRIEEESTILVTDTFCVLTSVISNQWPRTMLSALPCCCQYCTQTLPNLRNFNFRDFKIMVEKLKQYPWNASSETKVTEGYCWAITHVAELSCCGRSWSSVLAFGFQLDLLVQSNADIAPLFVTVYRKWL